MAATLAGDPGATIKLITSEPEPKGDDALLAKLLSRGALEGLTLPASMSLTQDPEMRTIIPEVADIYVSRVHKEGWTMVQPTLVVVDLSSGKVLPELSWSWKTMGYTADQDYVAGPSGIPVFRCRPDIHDLGDAIRERRAVKLIQAEFG